MNGIFAGACIAMALSGFGVASAAAFEKDVIQTSEGNLEITFIGHGTLMLAFNGQTIHVDPWTQLADYAAFPKADVILVTHEHHDHLDPAALDALESERTVVIVPPSCASKVQGGEIMKNGDVKTVAGIKIEAVPAYNLVHKRDNGEPFHPKGVGNGYVLQFADKRVFIAGDTENIPEMKHLKDVDVAFLPMNLPYTMTPEMAADAALDIRPEVLYPYHYGDTDTARIVELLQGKGIEVRIRKLQ